MDRMGLDCRGGERIDFVYNRLTDFRFTEEKNKHLRTAAIPRDDGKEVSIGSFNVHICIYLSSALFYKLRDRTAFLCIFLALQCNRRLSMFSAYAYI